MSEISHDERHGVHEAAQRTNLPLDDFMVRLVAQELPMVDTTSQSLVLKELREYSGPTITSQGELPEPVRRLLDL
ncbi:hypothetical protein [Corynebacterium frankenforstense]